MWTALGAALGGGGHQRPLCRRAQSPGGSRHGAACRGARAVLTFEEHDLVVAGPLVDCVHAVQVQGQAPPEPVDLSRLEGDQVLIAGQSPEVLAWRDRLGITDPPRRLPAPREKPVPRHASAVGSQAEGESYRLPSSSCWRLLFLAAVGRNPLFGNPNNPPATSLPGTASRTFSSSPGSSTRRDPGQNKTSESEPPTLSHVCNCPLEIIACYLHLLSPEFPRETSNRNQRCAFGFAFKAFSPFPRAGRL